MPATTFPGLGLRGGYNIGEDGWGAAATEDLRKLSMVGGGLKVFSRISGDLPDSPVDGDRYIILAEDSNSIAGDGDIVMFNVDTWYAYTPDDGWEAYVVDEDAVYRFVSGSWILVDTGAELNAYSVSYDSTFASVGDALDSVIAAVSPYVTLGSQDSDFGVVLAMNATTQRIRDSSNSGASIKAIVPNESSLNLPTGFTVSFLQTEDTQLEVEGEQDSNSATDVVLLYPSDMTPLTRRQYSVITLLKSDIADTWYVFGDLDPA